MKNLYKIITVIFQPLLMPTYGMALLMNMDVFGLLPALWRWVAVIGTFVFTGLLPAIPVLLLMRRGEVHDVFISRREERTMPYLFSFMAYVFWALFMWRTMQFPLFIVAMGIGSAISIFLITIINMRWKISAHMAGMGGLAGAIFGVSYRMAINPVWLFIIVLTASTIVALSRIELKAHSPLQTVAGFVVGFLAVFLPCFYF
ncbi:MAG TPA: phosphatase PAP2 family protein [Paludibacter sp.]|nr:phosphatase PAP2 family protein [Paludibacter sp.]